MILTAADTSALENGLISLHQHLLKMEFSLMSGTLDISINLFVLIYWVDRLKYGFIPIMNLFDGF